MQNVSTYKMKAAEVTDPFWQKYMEIVREEVIPYQWKALNDDVPDASPSHAIENFRIAAGEASGEFYGMVFQDSDVAKWLEAVAYSLENHPDPSLEETADEVIDLLEKAQGEDGYLNTYYTIKEPEKRWTNLRDNHELYCAGHLMEAAVAYYHATGKRKFLDIMSKYADYIDSVFGREGDKIPGYPGHQEIELALIRLYQATGKDKYLKLSQFFIEERGKTPHYFDIEKEARGDTSRFFWDNSYGYHQAHLPVTEQQSAVGHAVRAVYMYSAMADLAAITGSSELTDACKTLWKNVVQKQMYITAGIGSMEFGEAFSSDYDLPNDASYTETCASIGLVFWAKRMLGVEADAQYADVMERALYNGTISGMDLDGKRFFYVNPLEVTPEMSRRKDKRHIKPVRQKWFGCACCPPNLARLISSLGHYIYSQKNDIVYVHLYIGSKQQVDVQGQKVDIVQETNYPWDGEINLTVNPEQEEVFTLALRLPGWCNDASLTVNGEEIRQDAVLEKGYFYLRREWKRGDHVHLKLAMPIERIQAHPNVRENVGKIALQRGPLVYCVEEVDNGANLHNLFLPKNAKLSTSFDPDLLGGITVIHGEAERRDEASWGEDLYSNTHASTIPAPIKAIPYYSWCNREPGEMLVWMNETI